MEGSFKVQDSPHSRRPVGGRYLQRHAPSQHGGQHSHRSPGLVGESRDRGAYHKMQIDTGAAQSLLPYEDYIKLQTGEPLKKSDKRFQSYTKHLIEVKGYIILPTRYKARSINIKYYVVQLDQKPLISGQDGARLGLINRIHVVGQSKVATNPRHRQAEKTRSSYRTDILR